MRKTYKETVKMRGLYVFAAGLLLAAGTAVAQDSDGYPRLETAPAFTYVHNSPVLGGSQSFNCYGFGGTIAYNFTSLIGLAADLSGCRVGGLDNTYGVGSKVHVGEGTYVFGPRFTFRHFGKLQPFLETNFGIEHIRVKCNNGNAGNACGSITAVQPLPTDATVIVAGAWTSNSTRSLPCASSRLNISTHVSATTASSPSAAITTARTAFG
jgi:hypothetical protein